MIGGAYLAFEATEKILEKLLHEHEHEEQLVDAMADPAELEKLQVKGAIRTDFILSAEIMAIALASLGQLSLWTTAAALIAVAIAITVGVYGVVALIVKLDDIGLHMAERAQPAARAPSAMASSMSCPSCSPRCRPSAPRRCCGSAAASSLHGLEEMHILEGRSRTWSTTWPSRHRPSRRRCSAAVVEWLVNALGSRRRRPDHRRRSSWRSSASSPSTRKS